MRRFVLIIDQMIDRCLMLLFILIFLTGLYFCYDMWYVFNHANDQSLLNYKPTADSSAMLKKLSKDAIGWITVKDTGIDDPIMQGEDNLQYIDLDPYGRFSLSGSIFLDARNDPDFKDPYSMIYGHHMEYGVMFGALDRYVDQDYFDHHKKGEIITDDHVKMTFKIFAAIRTDAKVKLIFHDLDRHDHNRQLLRFLKIHAKIYEKPVSSHLIALSTCGDPATTDRWVVFGAFQK